MSARKLFTLSSLSDFIQKEIRQEDFNIKRIHQGNPEEQIVSGDVLGPLKIAGRHVHGWALLAENTFFSRFRAGDQVEIGIVDSISKKFRILTSTSIKMIRFPVPGSLEVIIAGELIPADATDLFLLPKSHSGIKKHLRQKLWDLERIGVRAEHRRINARSVQQNFSKMSAYLNSTQIEALKFLGDSDFDGLVQGPPGTGKTHLLVSLINLAVASGLRVGLAALSHAAVDNALARVLGSGLNSENVVRVASKHLLVKREPYGDIDVRGFWASSFADLESECSLYAATMHSWCMSSKPPDIDLLIIDEGSQVPLYFHPFLEKLCSRTIMFGDHNQLPPVIQTVDHDLPAEDIFSFQINQGSYPMLEIQYRMNEGVQEWSSNRFYHGRLKPHESNKDRDLLRGCSSPSGLLGKDVVNLSLHNGAWVNHANRFEASKVADLVWAIKNEGRIPLNEIGIVTPYRAQAGAICAALQEKLGLEEMQSLLVDTVERFQGQERETMILSMGAERDTAKRGDRAFLGDGKRLNVAVTRARSRFYCFAPNALVENTNKASEGSHLKSFFEWCG